MKTKLSFAVITSTIAFTAVLSASQDDWSYNNHWTIYGDYVRMKRVGIKDKKIVQDANPTTIQQLQNNVWKPKVIETNLYTKRAEQRFNFEPGYRVGLFYHRNKKNSFELSFLHVTDWDASSSVTKAGSLDVPFAEKSSLSDYYHGTHAREEYETKFDTAELNWWYHFTPRRENYFSFSSILGLRFFRVDESFDFSMTKYANKSNYKVNTQNRLYGGHLGFKLQWNPTDNLSWELMCKGGAFYNDLEQKTDVRDRNNTVTLAKYRRDGTAATFLGEAVLLGRYQLGRYFSIHLGYQFMYLDALALAPEQLSFRTTATYHQRLQAAASGGTVGTSTILGKRMSKGGYIKVHGGFAGLDISF